MYDDNNRLIEYIKITTNFGVWTRKYEPIKIIGFFDFKSKFDVDNKVKELMLEYGINNVRGGLYSNEVLEDYQIKTLENELDNINNNTYNNYFTRECLNKYNYYVNSLSKKKLKKDIEDDDFLNVSFASLTGIPSNLLDNFFLCSFVPN